MTLYNANCNWDKGAWIQPSCVGDPDSPRAWSDYLRDDINNSIISEMNSKWFSLEYT